MKEILQFSHEIPSKLPKYFIQEDQDFHTKKNTIKDKRYNWFLRVKKSHVVQILLYLLTCVFRLQISL